MVGDANRQDNLPLYRQAAEAVKPVWIPDEEAEELWIAGIDPDDMPDDMEDWIGRFFK